MAESDVGGHHVQAFQIQSTLSHSLNAYYVKVSRENAPGETKGCEILFFPSRSFSHTTEHNRRQVTSKAIGEDSRCAVETGGRITGG